MLRPQPGLNEGAKAIRQTLTIEKENSNMMKSIAIMATCTALATLSAVHAQSPAAASLNDAQIAMIAVVADQVDIDAGKMAAKKTQNKEVREFARTMVRDHTAVNAKATALVKKLGVTPEESATSKSLKADGDKMMTKLEGMSSAEFDKAYVDNEVSYHQAVIGVVTGTLIPNTKNEQLKSLLESAGPIFTSHLEHAKMLQKSLNK
jgi:putative membrane protein